MAESSPEACSICAWRATCSKRFSISGRDIRCPDFTMDVTVSSKPEADATDEGAK